MSYKNRYFRGINKKTCAYNEKNRQLPLTATACSQKFISYDIGSNVEQLERFHFIGLLYDKPTRGNHLIPPDSRIDIYPTVHLRGFYLSLVVIAGRERLNQRAVKADYIDYGIFQAALSAVNGIHLAPLYRVGIPCHILVLGHQFQHVTTPLSIYLIQVCNRGI